ncbi:hypothetical protein JB92DRAFT_1538176 [Gautieria morchelliformis]|nr:hypothetical protein JB92DRAFT_1538176 [Gautieria morchelliformis]
MLIKVSQRICRSRRERAEITQPHPAAAWLPHELIIHILQFTSGYNSRSKATRACLSLVHLCRGWHGPALSFLYQVVELTSMTSCLLFLRSTRLNPRLSYLVKSLIIPTDTIVWPTFLFVSRPSIIQRLVASCSSGYLESLQLPFPRATRGNKPLSAIYPNRMMLAHLKSLHISCFDIADVPNTRSFREVHAMEWLHEVKSLPALEELYLSGVKCTTSALLCPRMDCLRRIVFDHSDWLPLFQNVPVGRWAPNLRGLEITQRDFTRVELLCLENICHNLVPSLEELVVVRPWYARHADQTDWSTISFAQLSSLRRLRIVDCISPCPSFNFLLTSTR